MSGRKISASPMRDTRFLTIAGFLINIHGYYSPWR